MTQTRIEKVLVVTPGDDMPDKLLKELNFGECINSYMALYMDRPGYHNVKVWLKQFFPELRADGISKVLIFIR